MATETTNAPSSTDGYTNSADKDPSLGHLFRGIIDDGQKLIEQQFTLFKLDFQKDLNRAQETGAVLGLGIGLLFAAGIVLMFMLVYLLEWLFRPNIELWVCYAIVGGILAAIGGVVFYRGKQKLETLNLVPEETAQGMKENLQWKTSQN